MPSIAQLAFAITLSVIALCTCRRYFKVRRQRKGLPLPPGPTPIPVLGNTLSINLDEPWITYTKWHAIHGGVLYLRLLDQEIIILGSQQIATELLEKRSHLYSDRPFLATLIPFGGDTNFALSSYGDDWRLCRRIFHQTFRTDAAISFRPLQLRMARELILNMMDDPMQYPSHYFTFATAATLSVVYGYEPKPRGDLIVHTLEEYMAAAIPASTPERAILLKIFPFLLNIPDWCPGSKLKLEARRARILAEKMVEMPYQCAMDRITVNEGPINSMVSGHVVRMQQHNGPKRAHHMDALKRVASTTVQASGETTMSSLMTFTLAMVMHPHVWKRAQAQIDAVVGIDRLPDFDDKPSLPYVEAILRETMRWQPVAPLGIWHATTAEDVFNDQYIPQGATVVANAWAMSRDEARFPNAEEFIPERFLTEEGSLNDNNSMDFIFGFGRRICPGRHAADASLWSTMVTMLATLDFCRARDAQGNEIPFEPKYINGITHRPDTFPCLITPRSHIQRSFLERVLAM